MKPQFPLSNLVMTSNVSLVLFLILALLQSAQSLSNQTTKIGPGFWNVRSSFYIDGFNIGTQMSLVQLNNGKFLIFDTVKLNPDLLNDINTLTKDGSLIAAVIATHPFHTTFFPAFYLQFPKPPYYGTPRHLIIEPQIPWAGQVYDCNIRAKWLPEVHMRIPQGAEFVNPEPPSTNHFSGMHVFHPPSKTIHVDDTIIIDEPFEGDMFFHPSILTVGLFHVPEAPTAFKNWVLKYMRDWDFDNIVAAHNGVKLGGAKQQLQGLLADTEPVFDFLIVEFYLSPNATQLAQFQAMQAHEANCKGL